MRFNPERVRENAQKASTADLLDRITAYRDELEPEALTIIAQELEGRGVTPEMIATHERDLGATRSDGQTQVQPCSYCRNPSIKEGWGWHCLFGKVPLFPRRLRWCAEHVPKSKRQNNGKI